MVKVKFISKAAAEQIIPSDNMALISIREPAEWVSLSPKWKNVLEAEFHDVDPNPEPGTPLTNFGIDYDDLVNFNPLHAEAILNWVREMRPNVEQLIVHCHAGISRSAAVAKYIVDCVDGFEWENRQNVNYSLHNKHVYRVLMNHDKGEIDYDSIFKGE